MPGCQIIYERKQAGSLQVVFGDNSERGEVYMRKDDETDDIPLSTNAKPGRIFFKLADAPVTLTIPCSTAPTNCRWIGSRSKVG